MNNEEILHRYDSLMKDVERMKEQMSRSAGKLEQIEKQLDDEGFKSVEKAEKWIEGARLSIIETNNHLVELLAEAESLLEES